MTEEKKNLFDRALEALTNRQGKAAAAEAADQAATAKTAAFSAAAVQVKAGKAAAANTAALKAAQEKVAHQEAAAARAIAQKADTKRDEAARAVAGAPKKGVVVVKSLRIRAGHTTTSKVVAGLVNGDEVSILSTWSDGRDTWARLDTGWTAMVYDGKTCIKLVRSADELG